MRVQSYFDEVLLFLLLSRNSAAKASMATVRHNNSNKMGPCRCTVVSARTLPPLVPSSFCSFSYTCPSLRCLVRAFLRVSLSMSSLHFSYIPACDVLKHDRQKLLVAIIGKIETFLLPLFYLFFMAFNFSGPKQC